MTLAYVRTNRAPSEVAVVRVLTSPLVQTSPSAKKLSTLPRLFDAAIMPVRVPKLPGAKRSEIFCMGAAGVGVLTPLYLIMPGAEERLAHQTTKWAPRWERNISFFTSPVERGVQRIEPPVARAVQRLDDRLPLEKMAKRVDTGIRNGIARFNGPNGPNV